MRSFYRYFCKQASNYVPRRMRTLRLTNEMCLLNSLVLGYGHVKIRMSPMRFFERLSSSFARTAASVGPPSLEYFTWLLARQPLATVPELTNAGDGTPLATKHLDSRIVSAYTLAHTEFKKSGSGWDHALFDIKAEVHDALLSGDHNEASRVLSRPDETAFFWGFDDIAKGPHGEVEPHELVIRRLNGTTSWKALYALWIHDTLTSLAEAMGARRMIYPEMEPSDIGSHYATVRSADDLLKDIEETIGLELHFPNPFPNAMGLATKRGTVGFRALQAFYQAWRISEIAGKNPDFKVLEIGAGLGRTAYFADQMGVRNYTIVDIPLTNAAQASFLGRTLGEDRLRLHGEHTDAPLRIIPSTALNEIEESFDLIFNADSLTEMSPDVATMYWDFARRNSNTLLSINHEANEVTVRSLYTAAHDVCALRYPYWMRRGYVEEIITWRT